MAETAAWEDWCVAKAPPPIFRTHLDRLEVGIRVPNRQLPGRTDRECRTRGMDVWAMDQVSSSLDTRRAGVSGSSAQQAGLSEMY